MLSCLGPAVLPTGVAMLQWYTPMPAEVVMPGAATAAVAEVATDPWPTW